MSLPPDEPSRLPADAGPTDPDQGRPPGAVLADAPTTADGKVFERPHPLTPLIRGWLLLVVIVVAVGRQLVPDGESDRGLVDVARDAGGWVLAVVGAAIVLAALAGFLTWRFTRFVVDDEELRIETGWLFRQSKRIPFQRLQSIDVEQPFAARIFGIAELRLEAGAGDAGVRLRYLSRAKASRLRDYLLLRAAGEQGRRDDDAPTASAWTDIAESDEVLVRLTPRQLVLGFLLSMDLLVPLVILLVGLVVTVATQVVVFALTALIPIAIGLVTALGRNVLGQFNYTLSRSGQSLRVSRGLTSLTSQSAPVDRIQGINISQPVTWRRFDLWRVKIDVLGGRAASAEDGQSRQGLSLLFPVASRAQVDLALQLILPGVALEQIELHRSPGAARWLRWWQAPTLRQGVDDQVILTRRGVLVSSTDVVPHAKTQSVRITRGPVQRRLDLATVHVDTTPGPVTLTALHLSSATARQLATSQLARMQRARAQARPGTAAGPVRSPGPGSAPGPDTGPPPDDAPPDADGSVQPDPPAGPPTPTHQPDHQPDHRPVDPSPPADPDRPRDVL